MKVICKDNFDREGVNDRLICEKLSQKQADAVALALNSVAAECDFYLVVPDDYKLYEFEP